MKKQIIVVIGIIACVALCAAVWPRNAEVEELLAEPVKTAVNAEIEARSEKTPNIFIFKVNPAPEVESISESEPLITEITTEKETEKPAPTPAAAQTSQAGSKPAPVSTEPKPSDRTVIDGEPHVWIPGFGWIVDEGGGSVAEDMYENGNKIEIMGDDECPSSAPTAPPAEPEITSDVIYVELQPPVTKDSTPPAYKPNGEPYNP